MSFPRAAAILVLAVGAGACDRQVAGGKADGPAVFAEACARCHGDTGNPSDSLRQSLGVRDLTSPEFGARASIELIEGQVRAGSDNKIMPAFAGVLTEAQIVAVAAYVLALPRRD